MLYYYLFPSSKGVSLIDLVGMRPTRRCWVFTLIIKKQYVNIFQKGQAWALFCHLIMRLSLTTVFSLAFSTFRRNKELKEKKERKVVDDQTAIQRKNLLLGQDKLPPRSTDK